MASKIIIDSVRDLLSAATEKDVWILDGLIEEGDQVILSGQPKAGKSLMASQIALAVASGGSFLSWEAHIPRKVLYINLELRPKRFGRRLIAQVGGADLLEKHINLHTINCLRTLDIRSAEQRNQLCTLIKELKVELIIWDVLARMHGAEENDNASMRAVMHFIRVASADRAHIITHHTRKSASGQENVNQGAAGMRGASSIHGEADLIMSLHPRSGQGARYSVTFSARNIEAPEELLLNRNADLLFYEAAEVATQRLRVTIESAFETDSTCLATDLTRHLMDLLQIKERRAQQLMKEAIAQGWITRQQRQDKRYEYELLNNNDLITKVH